jgi:hypothetical protein
MTKKKIEIKVEFIPGCFDDFEGTPEELENLIAEINRMAQSGELQKKARPIDMRDPEQFDIEVMTRLINHELQETQKKFE